MNMFKYVYPAAGTMLFSTGALRLVGDNNTALVIADIFMLIVGALTLVAAFFSEDDDEPLELDTQIYQHEDGSQTVLVFDGDVLIHEQRVQPSEILR